MSIRKHLLETFRGADGQSDMDAVDSLSNLYRDSPPAFTFVLTPELDPYRLSVREAMQARMNCSARLKHHTIALSVHRREHAVAAKKTANHIAQSDESRAILTKQLSYF